MGDAPDSGDQAQQFVHRKRSQVAVVDQGGAVMANRNVPNGVEPILGVIGDLPIGTAVAFEAAFGWGWLVELGEDYGFTPHLVHPSRCKAIASARLTNDKVDAHILAQLLRADFAAGGVDRPAGGASAARGAAAPYPAGPAAHPAAQTASTRYSPTTASTGSRAAGPDRAGNGWPGCRCRPAPAR